MAEFRHAGTELAAHTFDLLRAPGSRERTAQSPYPRGTSLGRVWSQSVGHNRSVTVPEGFSATLQGLRH
jgi:hypothetical protein